MRHIHKVAAMVIKDNAFLMVRKTGKDILTSLGGKVEAGETEEQALLREIKEEVNCGAKIGKKLGDFTDVAIFDPNCELKLSVYIVELVGTPQIIDNELEAFEYVPKDYEKHGIKLTSVIINHVIPLLKKERLLNW